MIDARHAPLPAFAALLLAAAAPALAADDLSPAISEVGETAPRAPAMVEVGGAVRLSLVRDKGLDAFAAIDVLPHFSLTAVHPFLGSEAALLYPAVGFLWEPGGMTDSARGVDSTLTLHRLGLVLEERYAPWRPLYFVARLVPAALYESVRFTDQSVPAALDGSTWTYSVDASLGAAFRVSPAHSVAHLWLMLDGGYGWVPGRDLTLSPHLEKPDMDKAGTTSLGALAPRGPFVRFGLVLSI